jgi:DNA-binding response OmpR family regulator
MASARRILIADPDAEAARSLSQVLRHQGYQVHYAPDGSRALEVAVLRHPDVVLFDDDCRFVDARTFQQILRTNPRTEHLPVLMITRGLEPDRVRSTRDGYLRKPFNFDEVLSRLDQIIRRADAARQMKGQGHDFQGTLDRLHLTDLLQILAMNRRSGQLALRRVTQTGEIVVRKGELVGAQAGPVSGEKALFRLLTWTEGSFSFVQDDSEVPRTLHRTMDDAILEGMRHFDESRRLLTLLPANDVSIVAVGDVSISMDQHPVTAEVLDLLHSPRTLPEVLDLSPAADLEILSVVAALLQRGFAQAAKGASGAAEPLLPAAQAHALRAKILRGRPNTPIAVAKVFILGKLPAAPRRVMSELRGFAAINADPEGLKSGFGTFGSLALSESLRLDFCLIPTGDSARPLWRPFCAGGIGAIALDMTPDTIGQAEYLAAEWKLPLVAVDHELPGSLARSPAGAAIERGQLEDALRTLLALFLEPGGHTAIGGASTIAPSTPGSSLSS